MNIKKISINSKFLGAQSTGVQRVAESLIYALDDILDSDQVIRASLDVEIIAPKGASSLAGLKHIPHVKKGILSGKFKNIPWEQLNLPFLIKGSTLLSLCNLSSIFKFNALVMIHDAQVYITPKSYSIFFRAWYKFMLPTLGRVVARHVFTVSEFSKSQLVSFGVAKPENITVVHNGCDHVNNITADYIILERLNLIQRSYFLAQANVQEHKNIKILLEAFSNQRLSNKLLVLYGSKIKEDFEERGIKVPNNVVFAGRVSDQELKALLENATATLTPSLTEGFGLQPLEGMLLGTPAVVSTKGALPEVCGDVGFYADPDKASEWIEAIQQVINYPKPELTNKVISHAQNYTWERSARKICDYILNNP